MHILLFLYFKYKRSYKLSKFSKKCWKTGIAVLCTQYLKLQSIIAGLNPSSIIVYTMQPKVWTHLYSVLWFKPFLSLKLLLYQTLYHPFIPPHWSSGHLSSPWKRSGTEIVKRRGMAHSHVPTSASVLSFGSATTARAFSPPSSRYLDLCFMCCSTFEIR